MQLYGTGKSTIKGLAAKGQNCIKKRKKNLKNAGFAVCACHLPTTKVKKKKKRQIPEDHFTVILPSDDFQTINDRPCLSKQKGSFMTEQDSQD